MRGYGEDLTEAERQELIDAVARQQDAYARHRERTAFERKVRMHFDPATIRFSCVITVTQEPAESD